MSAPRVDRFLTRSCADVLGGSSLRPNQLLAISLPHAPLAESSVVRACAPLLTSIGLPSLDPADSAYIGAHRGEPAERDRAYHQARVWPWLIGPCADAARKLQMPGDGLLDAFAAHLGDWGLGSVSETANGDAPHAGSGCPFQAWSVAETQRARRRLSGAAAAP